MQEPCDDVLVSGNVVANRATPLASIVLGLAVRQGAPQPSISTADELKRTLLAAKSVAYADPKGGAAVGAKFDEALRTLGIAAQIEPKLRRTANNFAALQLVAQGEADIGVSFVSEMNTPGSEILGPFPSSVSPPARVVGFVSSHANDLAAAKALLQYLSSAEAAAVYKAKRLMPVR
jgi:molybdate transport system substrate-binding protein